MAVINDNIRAAAAKTAAKASGVSDKVTSTEVWDALKSTNVTHALAGGGLGMVANAGYNYTADERGGYLASGLAGAGAGVAASIAWRTGGKELYHTAQGKVKTTVATATGHEDFAIRTHAGNQHLKTTKDGSFDLSGQKQMVRDLEAKLAGMDASSSEYSSVMKQVQEAHNGLDHMQSVIDNRLSKTAGGAAKLRDKYGTHLDTMKGTQNYSDMAYYDEMAPKLAASQGKLDKSKADLLEARRAYKNFRKSGGDVNGEVGRGLRDIINTRKNDRTAARKDFMALKNDQRLGSVSQRMDSPEMKRFREEFNTVKGRYDKASSLVNSYNNSVLDSVSNSLNMAL